MNHKLPRLIVITRPSPLEMLVRRFGTVSQAQFYVESRGRSFYRPQRAHELQQQAIKAVLAAIPSEQRRVQLSREYLDRFLFAPDDVIVAVGQDGLVPNVAKYLHGQKLVGFNPDFETWSGVLCCHNPNNAAELIEWVNGETDKFTVQKRAMALATREDGQSLLALNELFVGHRSHQSAKYRIEFAGAEERQSSSGVIISTGTGATGWTASIVRQRSIEEPLPDPEDRLLTYMVREPWPSIGTGVELDFGLLTDNVEMILTSEMEDGGVIFGDGIEADYLEFNDGQTVKISVARRTLNLVTIPAYAVFA